MNVVEGPCHSNGHHFTRRKRVIFGTMKFLLLAILASGHWVLASDSTYPNRPSESIPLDTIPLHLIEASRLVALPLHCLKTEFPNKLNQVLGTAEEIGIPSVLHPAFYGCFDWHSSVHGHWMLVALLRRFPELPESEQIIDQLRQSITDAHIQGELDYFLRTSETTFERTYGWAWLLRLSLELQQWKTPLGDELAGRLEPLTRLIVQRYQEYLPRLVYPIRSGEHPNTAFGLSHAWDYASFTRDSLFLGVIETHAFRFFAQDRNAPLSWEPSGYDFLSPCLEEANLMRRVMPEEMFRPWLREFLPGMSDPAFTMPVGEVRDRTDGKLVHLDGLNFSRAWCLYELSRALPEYGHLRKVADDHIANSLPRITDGSYAGEHWLASFACFALTTAYPVKQ